MFSKWQITIRYERFNINNNLKIRHAKIRFIIRYRRAEFKSDIVCSIRIILLQLATIRIVNAPRKCQDDQISVIGLDGLRRGIGNLKKMGDTAIR